MAQRKIEPRDDTELIDRARRLMVRVWPWMGAGIQSEVERRHWPALFVMGTDCEWFVDGDTRITAEHIAGWEIEAEALIADLIEQGAEPMSEYGE